MREATDRALIVSDSIRLARALDASNAGNIAACGQAEQIHNQLVFDGVGELSIGVILPGSKIATDLGRWARGVNATNGTLGPGTAYQVRFDPAYPGRPDPAYSVDTSTFTSGATTANGGVRNSRQFWGAWSAKESNGLSAENLACIHRGRAPVVASDWLRTFPEHRGFEWQTLFHHHMDYGQYAIPVPRGAPNNSPGSYIWHSARGTE